MSLESRKEWDSYIVKLEAIDRDSRTGSEIIHYILKYPVSQIFYVPKKISSFLHR